jgi:hypothetical protein
LTVFYTLYLLLLALACSANAGPNARVEIGIATLSPPCGLGTGDRVEFLVGARQMEGVRQIKFDFSWTPSAAIDSAKGSTAEATEAKAFIAPGPPQIEGDTASYGMAVFAGDGLFGEGLLAKLSLQLGNYIDANTPLAIYLDAVSLGPSFAERDTILPIEAVILANYCDAQNQPLARGFYLDTSRHNSPYSPAGQETAVDASAGEINLVARLLENSAFAAGQDITWQIENSGPGALYAFLQTGEIVPIAPGERGEVQGQSDRRGSAHLLLDASADNGQATTVAISACAQGTTPTLCAQRELVWEKAVTAVVERDGNALPDSDRLLANYPNPFNAGTTIPLAIAAPHEIAQLAIVNLVGQRVATIFSGPLEPGQYQLHWDGRDQHGRPVASGVYFYQLQLGNQQQLRRMLLLR